jgi:hypothetical protein
MTFGGEAATDVLVRAIGGKHLVEFLYNAGHTRIVGPRPRHRRGIECLLAFQISAESHSRAVHGCCTTAPT